MRVFGRDVPCGCDSRRAIIFEHGNVGGKEAAAVLAIGAILVVAWKYGHRS